MRERVWNAPARLRLTALVIAVLSMGLLAVASLAFVSGPSRREPAAPDRPVFARRRMVTLPAVVVTAPAHAHRAANTGIRPR